jgi:hypothetical protein
MSTISALKAHFPTIHHHFNTNLRCSTLNQPPAILTTCIMGKYTAVPSDTFRSHYAQYLEFDESMNIGTSLGGQSVRVTDKQTSSKDNGKLKICKNYYYKITTLFRHT